MSQLEASIHFSAPFVLDCVVNDREQGRQGNRDPGAAPHGVYPCLGDDRWIAIACTSDQQWQSLQNHIAPTGDGWPFEKRFATLMGRKAEEDELDSLMGQWTPVWDARKLMETLQVSGVPAGMVNDTSDLFQDPQLIHRQHFQYLDHPEIGVYATERSELTLSLTPGNIERPAPLMGQHTEEVLTGFWGLSTEEYQSLKEDGALD